MNNSVSAILSLVTTCPDDCNNLPHNGVGCNILVMPEIARGWDKLGFECCLLIQPYDV